MIQTSDNSSFTSAARLGPNHGYSIDGDIALLHADVEVPAGSGVQAASWAVQLWACEAPHAGGPLSGVKIAEAPLHSPSLGRNEQALRLDTEARARVPGGQRDYSMVLVLASGEAGSFDQIHDFANYPERQRFITPHLEGSVGYSIDGSDVVLRADQVFSPRHDDNLSGSLRLELWALDGEYRGGAFAGFALASLDLGRLAGGRCFDSIEARVAFQPPAPGTWRVVLMLREWAGDVGYVTRDYCNFAVPYVAQAAAQPAPAVTAAAATRETAPATSGPAAKPAADVMHGAAAPAAETKQDTAAAPTAAAKQNAAAAPTAAPKQDAAAAPTAAARQDAAAAPTAAAKQDAAAAPAAAPKQDAASAPTAAAGQDAAATPTAAAKQDAAAAKLEGAAKPEAAASLAATKPAASVAHGAAAKPVETTTLGAATKPQAARDEATLASTSAKPGAPELKAKDRLDLPAEPASAPRELRARPLTATPALDEASTDTRVSILRASVDELAVVKGLNRKLAAEIIKHRPYKSIDDLVKVRGIGPKMLATLRAVLSL